VSVRSFLRRVFSVTLANGLVERNPVKAVKFFHEPSGRVRFLTQDEAIPHGSSNSLPADRDALIIKAMTAPLNTIRFGRTTYLVERVKESDAHLLPVRWE